MAAQYKVGRFTQTSGGTPQDQSINGVGFEPKGLWLFTVVEGGSIDTILNHNAGSIGWSDGTNNRAIAFRDENAVITSDTEKVIRNDTVIRPWRFTDGAGRGLATVKSFDADGFTLTWTQLGFGYEIYYVAFGGDDLTAVEVGSFTGPASTGIQNVATGIDTADFLAIMCVGTTVENTQLAHSQIMLGMASSPANQCVCSIVSRDNVNPGDTSRYQRTNEIIAVRSAGGAGGSVFSEATLDAFTALGFDLDWTDAGTGQTFIYFTAKGGKWEVGNGTFPLTVSTKSFATGFEPKGLFTMGFGNVAITSVVDDTVFHVGATDGTDNVGISVSSDDGVSPTVTQRYHSETKSIVTLDPASAATTDEADIDSFNASNFTMDFTKVSGIAKEFLWFVFGDNDTPPPTPGQGGIASGLDPCLAAQGNTKSPLPPEFCFPVQGEKTGSGGGAFSPTDISNCELWLDASDASTINLGVGNGVATWEDKSGQGNDVSQGTGTNQPLTNTETLNGKNVLVYDGIDDSLVSAVFANSPLTQPTTIYAVIDNKNNTTNLRYPFDGITANDRHAGIISNHNQQVFAGATLGFFHYPLGVSLYKYVFDGTSSGYSKQQIDLITGNAGAHDLTGITLGTRYSLSSFLVHNSAEFIIYNKIVPGDEDTDLVTYLQEKWMPKVEPNTISNLQIWLDANVGLTLTGSDVDVWADQSGQGNDASSVVGNKPVYNATGLNGLPTVEFTGGNSDYLQITDSADFDSSTGYEIFMVIKKPAAAALQTLLRNRSLGSLGGNIPGLFIEIDGNDRYQIGFEDASGSHVASVGAPPTIPEDRVLIVNYHTNLTLHDIEHNGVDQALGEVQTSGTVGTVTSPNNLFIGCEPGLSRFATMSLSELLFFNAELTAENRNFITNYLKFKYGA
jgi:hypothetical protein